MRRPTGLTFVAVLAIVLGLAQIAVSLGYFDIATLGFLRAEWLVGDVGAAVSSVAYGIGIGLVVLGVMGIAFGIGALGVRKWAWPIGIATYLLAIAGAIFMLFVTETAVAAAVTGVVSALFAWYLSTDDVRQAFGQETTAAGGQRPHVV